MDECGWIIACSPMSNCVGAAARVLLPVTIGKGASGIYSSSRNPARALTRRLGGMVVRTLPLKF